MSVTNKDYVCGGARYPELCSTKTNVIEYVDIYYIYLGTTW